MNKMRGARFLERGREAGPIPHVRLATQQSFNLLFKAVLNPPVLRFFVV
jgi:hypothetical protein